MEMGLKCKIPWCQQVVKNEKDALNHIKSHLVADFFMKIPLDWEDTTKEGLRCIFCLHVLNEKALEHIEKHQISDFFDAVAILKW
jgi:hypothetical protein